MAQPLLQSAPVILLRALILSVAVGFAATVSAGEVEDRTAQLATVEGRQRALLEERRALSKTYDDKAAAIATLKAQTSSWSRDRKLQGLLAESKDMAALLDRKDGELRAQALVVVAERKALLAALDRELAAQPSPARAEELGVRRRALAQALAAEGRPLRLPDDHIEPGDDAADLDYKAAALAQGERSLRAEEQRLATRVTYFRKQAKLTRSRTRADEADIFHDEAPRRGSAPATKSGGPSRGDTAAENDGGGGGPTSTPPVGAGPPGTSTPPGSSTPPTPTTSFDSRGVDLAADPSVILVDVVAESTLDELRRAERSGDPESMARAAERAALEVKARAERLRARRMEIEQRARALRGETP